MAATFPSTVRQLTPKVDVQDTILADHVNSLQDEVRAIETVLGSTATANNVLVSSYTGTFSQTTTWGTLGDRLLNIEAGLISGTGQSAYVGLNGGSLISPNVGSVGLTIQATSGNSYQLLITKSSSGTLGFNVDSTGTPKVGTYNVVYVNSSDWNSIQTALSSATAAANAAQAAANSALNPFLLSGV
jgi:hypothetical protein